MDKPNNEWAGWADKQPAQDADQAEMNRRWAHYQDMMLRRGILGPKQEESLAAPPIRLVILSARRDPDEPLVSKAVAAYLEEWYSR